MSTTYQCYRCGESLAPLSMPLSRRDQCPGCSADLHVCKMCVAYDAKITRQCREDGAEDVTDKERPNFCDWFKPDEAAFDPSVKSAADVAAAELEALFANDGD